MQAYDILMLVVIGAATLFGMIKGFAWQVASLASIIVSYFVAYNFREQVAAKIQAEAPWNLFLAMLLLYAGTSFAIWFVFRMVSGSIDRVRLRDFDRQLGAAFGLAKGGLYCMLITMFAMTLLGARQQQAIVASSSGKYISQLLAAAKGVVLPHEIDAVIRPQLEKLQQKLDNSNGTIVNQTNQGSDNWFGGQGGNSGVTTPMGIPTSLQGAVNNIEQQAIGAATDTAKNLLNWQSTNQPPQNSQNNFSSPAGWGGQSANAPLPNTYNFQQLPNTNNAQNFQQQLPPPILPQQMPAYSEPPRLPSQQQHGDVLPF